MYISETHCRAVFCQWGGAADAHRSRVEGSPQAVLWAAGCCIAHRVVQYNAIENGYSTRAALWLWAGPYRRVGSLEHAPGLPHHQREVVVVVDVG